MPFSIKSFNSNLSIILFLATIAGAQFYWLWQVKEFDLALSAMDAFGCYGLLYTIFLFIQFSQTYHLNSPWGYFTIGVQSLLIAISWVYCCEWTILYAIPHDDAYALFWKDYRIIRILIGWLLLCDFYIINYLIGKAKKEQQSTDQNTATLQLRKEAELFKLRQQLHPHFLFNSLNSINALIGKEPQQARAMIQQLSEFLRHTLKKEDNDFILFQEELDDLRIYLSIEQVRFGHRLKITEQVEESCLPIKIPPFLLQPLVENAIKYGLYGTTGLVEIHIRVQQSKQQLIFSIVNPYDPHAVNIKGTGFGLESVKRRLYLLFARNDLLTTRTESKKGAHDDKEDIIQYYFTATIQIPLTDSGANEILFIDHEKSPDRI